MREIDQAKYDKVFREDKPEGNVYDHILRMCVDDNHPNFRYREPFIQGDYAVATEGHIMCYFDKNLSTIEEHGEVPQIKKYLGENCSRWISVVDFTTELMRLPIESADISIGKDIICNECEGEGLVHWEYKRHQREFDCPECNGTGYSHMAKIVKSETEFEFAEGSFVDIVKCNRFRAWFMADLVRIANLLNQDKIQIVNYTKVNEATTFKIGDVFVLVMPCLKNLTPTMAEIVKVKFHDNPELLK